jgi:SAM-dependent methyltransferase
MERYSDYDAFAWFYNKEWTAFGERVFPVLKKIAGEKLTDKAKILDLCCGTGQLVKVLLEKGYGVTGIDGSKEMLRYARQNAPDAKFILKDARAFRLPPIFNAAFSTFDSLNHVMVLKELYQVFRNVDNCLVNGGIFIFDLTTKKHFEILQKGFKDVQEKPDFLYTVRCDYNEEKKISESHFTIFQPRGKNWKRSDIKLYQTFYPREEVESALQQAGFTDIRAFSFDRERGLQEASEDSIRIFFYAQKP